MVGERKGVELPRREVVRFGVPLFIERREFIEVLRIRPGDANWPSVAIPFKFAFVKGPRGGARVLGETGDRRRSLAGLNGGLDLGWEEVDRESLLRECKRSWSWPWSLFADAGIG